MTKGTIPTLLVSTYDQLRATMSETVPTLVAELDEILAAMPDHHESSSEECSCAPLLFAWFGIVSGALRLSGTVEERRRSGPGAASWALFYEQFTDLVDPRAVALAILSVGALAPWEVS